ncbi:aminotransferase class III-fold pyridoxal phosphate-dependent enzyme [Candidatus Woesearchaeota archaeon]|nr:aminotransferase class III-fold pyridoxal phosphate-dependent enzyme [Candidatus Woesearchaeota archaeon]
MENTTRFEEIKQKEDAYQLTTYAKYPVAIEQGKGVYVYDAAGKKYLDFYAGHAVAVTGHCHPNIVKAVQAQAEKLMFYSNAVYNSTRAAAAESLIHFGPYEQGLTKVFFCNSGAEANETAIKIARKYTGKTTILACHHGFHGRTYGALSITGYEKYRIFPPHLPGIAFVPFGDITALQEKIEEIAADLTSGGIACLIMEPIQSMAGVIIAELSYYQAVRELCTKHGIVLIFDEVQTGFGRTGKPFFAQTINITPDLMTCAKGIASGLPMGAVLIRDTVAATIKLGEQGSTFGGGPLASAALLATIQTIQQEELCKHAEEQGASLMKRLEEANIPGVKEIRGKGLMIGVEFFNPEKNAPTDVKPLVLEMLKNGVIVSSSEDKKTIRLLPPLTINEHDIKEIVTTMKQAATILFGATAKGEHLP